MIPRKNEVDAVAAILESETPLLDDEGSPVVDDSGEPVLVPAYDTPQDMAKAVVKALADELLKRELHVIVPQHGAQGWGPYWTRTEAERAWRKEIGAAEVGPAGLLRVFPWAPPVVVLKTTVCACGHDKDNHVSVQRRGGTARHKECGMRCDCKAYEAAA